MHVDEMGHLPPPAPCPRLMVATQQQGLFQAVLTERQFFRGVARMTEEAVFPGLCLRLVQN